MSEIERLFFAIGVAATFFGIAGFVFWLVHHIVFVFDKFRENHEYFEKETNQKIITLLERIRELEKKFESEKKED